jgi:putative membrane protein
MIDNLYLWVKALHVIAIISWMAGLLYLPRLFVYHSQVAKGSEADTMLQTMERKLLRYIMNPAMITSFALGIWLIVLTGAGAPDSGAWIHAKILCVLALAGCHGMMSKYRKNFVSGTNTKSQKFFRVFNEVPTILMILIVILATLKPF